MCLCSCTSHANTTYGMHDVNAPYLQGYDIYTNLRTTAELAALMQKGRVYLQSRIILRHTHSCHSKRGACTPCRPFNPAQFMHTTIPRKAMMRFQPIALSRRICMSLSRLHLWRFTFCPLESNTPTDCAHSGDWIRVLVPCDFHSSIYAEAIIYSIEYRVSADSSLLSHMASYGSACP